MRFQERRSLVELKHVADAESQTLTNLQRNCDLSFARDGSAGHDLSVSLIGKGDK